MVAAANLQEQAAGATGTARNVIEVENLSIHYGETAALEGVNLAVRENEIFGIIGPAGSGKTSFLKAINRMDLFTTGMAVKGEAYTVDNRQKDFTAAAKIFIYTALGLGFFFFLTTFAMPRSSFKYWPT